MSRYTLVPFEGAHYLAIPARREEAAMQAYKPLLVDRLEKSTSAYTLLDSGVPLVCGGVWVFWPGFAELWLHGGDSVASHPIPVVRTAHRLVDRWVKELKLHRVQMTLDESFAASFRLAEALGFEFESRMLRYGPNQETFLRYVLLP